MRYDYDWHDQQAQLMEQEHRQMILERFQPPDNEPLILEEETDDE